MESTKVFSNFMWRFFERWGAQGVTLIVSIVLARVLGPEVYGTIALVTVFTTILQVFVDSGLGMALIQKKEADDLDFSSVFWFNIVACLVLYLGMFLCAPFIANFYNKPEIVSVIRVLSLIIVLSGVKNIQQAYVSKNMMFKKFFFSTLGGTVFAAILGITLAYRGFGIWALVWQYLCNASIDMLILWITVGWRPQFIFSITRFKELFSFGWKMLVSSLIDTVYNEVRSLIIGKYYSSQDLAYYSKGTQFPQYAVSNINSSMNSVLLPVLAEKQDDKEAIKVTARKVIRCSSFIIWPMLVGMCVTADKIIVMILTEKWLPATMYMQIFCIAQAFQPLQTTNLSIVKALGRSDLHLKLEVVKKCIAITIVIVSSFVGVTAIAIGALIYSFIASIINAYPNKKLVGYGYIEQFKDVLPYIGISLTIGVIEYIVGFVPINIYLGFILQISIGFILYYVLSSLLRVAEIEYIKKLLKEIVFH